MATVRDVLALLDGFHAEPDPRTERSLRLTRDLLEQSAAPFSRRTFSPGHITASGIVLSPDLGRVLLIFHRRLRRWLQPGGHVEPDDRDVVAAARREVVEETGVTPLSGPEALLVGVDVHQIPPRRDEPPHLHHDLVFRFLVGPDDAIAAEAGRDVVWSPLERLENYAVDGPFRRSVERAIAATQTESPSNGSPC